MENQTIQVVRDVLKSVPSGVYFQKVPKDPTKIFYSQGNNGVADSLESCSNEGYQALFMPELAKVRIGSQELWKNWFLTPSLRATGTTKQGSKVVVYAHIPNYFSNPANIRNAVDGKLNNGAGPMPQEEFNRLEALNGNGRVFVIPYETLKQSSSGVIKVDDALEHPQTIPFLGLGREGAEKYLAKHREVYGYNIGIWHSDDFNKKDPLGRVLCLGDGYLNGLLGGDILDYDGRVFGVVVPEALVAQNLESRI